MSSADLVELVHSLQTQLAARGAGAFRTLELAFDINDKDRNGTFDFAEIEAILAKSGLFLKRQHLTKLYRHFDVNHNERLYYPDLLGAIRGTLSARRLNILNQVFDALDSGNHGAVDQDRLIRVFEQGSPRHPQVLSGEKKAAEVTREFALAFQGAGALNNGAVTRDEFIHFYGGISASLPYDDDFFVNIIQRCWGIKEFVPASLASTILAPSSSSSSSASAASSSTPLLQRVRAIFREKVRQRTVNTKSEVENLRLVFKHFDLSNSGQVDLSAFRKTLARFGITLDDTTTAALFAEFDRAGTGRIDYLLFATTLYEDDTTSAAFHQFNRSAQLKAAAASQQLGARPDSRREYIDTKEIIVSAPAASAAAASSNDDQWKRATARRTLSQKERESSVLPTVVFALGAPGSGVGTQCARVVREFGFTHLNVPELLASERARPGSALGAAMLSANGAVSPDALVSFLSKQIQDAVNKGSLYFIVDGFPTTLAARATFEKAMSGRVDVPFVIYFETTQTVMEQRLAARAKNTGVRADSADVLTKKFQAFAKDTIPVINSFGQEGRLQVVDASQMPDDVYAQVQGIVAQL